LFFSIKKSDNKIKKQIQKKFTNMSINLKSKNKQYISCFVSALTLCFFIFSNSIYGQKKPPPDKLLVGKIYTIELAAQGKKAGDPAPDEISFKSDKFTSKLMKTDEKFAPSVYIAEADSTGESGKTISFESESKNPDAELLKWTGTITGDDIEGTVIWTSKKGKIKKEYTYAGTLKGKKKK